MLWAWLFLWAMGFGPGLIVAVLFWIAARLCRNVDWQPLHRWDWWGVLLPVPVCLCLDCWSPSLAVLVTPIAIGWLWSAVIPVRSLGLLLRPKWLPAAAACTSGLTLAATVPLYLFLPLPTGVF